MTTATTTVSTQREPELLGQIVVVIVGSTGIGLEIARRARAESASVILTGHNPERLKQAALALGAQHTATFDANDPTSMQSFFQDLPTAIDHVRVTAGAPPYGPPLAMPPEEARRGLTEHLLFALGVARGAADKVRPPTPWYCIHGRHGRTPPTSWPRNRLDCRVPYPHRQPRAQAGAGPRQSDRRRLRRHTSLGINPRRRPRQASRR
jgi:NAD(P)-dependent dehydrogenase (short-subunit alcohol dehydrogenase family)